VTESSVGKGEWSIDVDAGLHPECRYMYICVFVSSFGNVCTFLKRELLKAVGK